MFRPLHVCYNVDVSMCLCNGASMRVSESGYSVLAFISNK